MTSTRSRRPWQNSRLKAEAYGGEPVQNAPHRRKEEGQKILRLIDNQHGTYDLTVKKLEE